MRSVIATVTVTVIAVVAATPIQPTEVFADEGARGEAQGPAADALYAISRDFPDDFAYSEFTATGFTVAFAGAAPDAAIDRLEATGIDFDVVTGVGRPQLALEDEMTRISKAVLAHVDAETNFSVESNPRNSAFVVTLYTGDEQLAVDVASATRALRSSLSVPVEFASTDVELSLASIPPVE
ncbi:hypothetical protein ABIE21_001330 [Conyzicola nivalis]|uniref:Uncharacterized protein n=1 Tax=Conyzicola nivalis TaxID=1477021 RepID=A0ABV2QLA8_9MICO